MSVMRVERQENVAWLLMDDGKNLHNPIYIETFLRCLDEIEADPDITAVIFTSTDDKNFSQGIDLAWIMERIGDPARHDEIRSFLHGLNAMFTRALTFPLPIIAALNGHAYGDGAILACACDFRVMRRDKGFFCFPEIDVNIPFMPGMWAVVSKAVPRPLPNRMALGGIRLNGDQMAAAGVAEFTSADGEALKAEAFAFARQFQKGRGIMAEQKRRMHDDILRVIEQDDPPLIGGLKLLY